MDGWIKLHRSLLGWEWYDDINVKVLFIHLLLRANHSPQNWRGETVETGALITSLSKLANETGLSQKQIRNALKKLEKTEEICIQKGRAWTKVIISNYGSYQGVDKEEGTLEGTPGAHEGQTRGTRGATNKNVKNVKNEKKERNVDIGAPAPNFTPPSLEEVKNYCQERKNNVNPEKWLNFYASKGWMIGKNKMKDWKAAVRTWEDDKGSSPSGGKKSSGAVNQAPPSDEDYASNPFLSGCN
jgi:hypothetical protein